MYSTNSALSCCRFSHGSRTCHSHVWAPPLQPIRLSLRGSFEGRASYLGERSAGHQDPGATSSALLFEAAARAFES